MGRPEQPPDQFKTDTPRRPRAGRGTPDASTPEPSDPPTGRERGTYLRTVAALCRHLDAAAQHIRDMGCTCLRERGEAHKADCMGAAYARQYTHLAARTRETYGLDEQGRKRG